MNYTHPPRSPGKRQIRPSSSCMYNGLDLSPDDDISDEDFVEKQSSDDSDETTSDDESDYNDADDNKIDEFDKIDRRNPKPIAKLCGLCLNQNELAQHDELLECDKCGLVVHAHCYGVDDETVEDGDEGDHSPSSTEPWFCEPCLYGLGRPPHCQLCPNRDGAFKRTDVGDKWVHILCALFTPGVTFSDIDHLTAVSYLEMDWRAFGRKPCALCTDRLLARTGVTVECEAGLCGVHMHISCAHKHGLLVDQAVRLADKSKPAVDPRFVNCKKHANPIQIAVKRRAYLALEKQQNEKRWQLGGKVLTDREQRKRMSALKVHKRAIDLMEGVTICRLGRKSQKRPRPLHSSAELVKAFKKKAAANGQDAVSFEGRFFHVAPDLLRSVPAAFSQHFLEYFSIRDQRYIPDEQKRLVKLGQMFASAKKRQHQLQQTHRQLQNDTDEFKARLVETGRRMSTFLQKTIELTQCTAKKQRSTDKMRTSAVINDVQMNVNFSMVAIVLKQCAHCVDSANQHQLIHCDTCQKDYHLNCLNPPLTKMPRKNARWGWQCSNCGGSSDSEASVEIGHSQKKVQRLTTRSRRRNVDDDCDDSKVSRKSSVKNDNGNSIIDADTDPAPPKKRASILAKFTKKARRRRREGTQVIVVEDLILS